MATYFVDPISGNDANDGLSFANRKKFITGLAGAAGDTVKVIASPDPTSLGINATWTNYSPTITLASGVTANLSTCDTAWTGALNVTATVDSTSGNYKEGTGSAKMVIAAAFTVGIVAYFDLGATTDFSAYQQVSLWFKSTAGSGTAFQIRLCSDPIGAVPVETFSIPSNLSGAVFHAVTFDKGSALSALVRSISLFCVSDPGAVTINLDNILACKASASADSLTLSSLIGKNTAGEAWYPLQSINGTTVVIGGAITLTAGSANLRGYYGTTEAVTTYKREGFLMATNSSQTVSSWATLGFSGTAASPVTISGGWDRTNMSSLTGDTYMLQSSNNGVGFSAVSRSWVNISHIHCIQFYRGFYFVTCNNITLTGAQCHGNFAYAIDAAVGGASNNMTFISPNCQVNANYGIVPGNHATVTSPTMAGNTTSHYFMFQSNNCSMTNGIAKNGNVGIDFADGSNNRFYELVTDTNSIGTIDSGMGDNYVINSLLADTTEFDVGINFSGGVVYSHKNDQTSDNHKIFMDGGVITSDTSSNRHTASGVAWKMSPTSTNRSSTYPMELVLARIACRANKLVTVKVWEKRSTSAITAKMLCKGDQIAGVPVDVVATASAADNTYEQLSITFTPTETGVVEITVQAYGGTTDSAWFDDFTIYQS